MTPMALAEVGIEKLAMAGSSWSTIHLTRSFMSRVASLAPWTRLSLIQVATSFRMEASAQH